MVCRATRRYFQDPIQAAKSPNPATKLQSPGGGRNPTAPKTTMPKTTQTTRFFICANTNSDLKQKQHQSCLKTVHFYRGKCTCAEVSVKKLHREEENIKQQQFSLKSCRTPAERRSRSGQMLTVQLSDMDCLIRSTYRRTKHRLQLIVSASQSREQVFCLGVKV